MNQFGSGDRAGNSVDALALAITHINITAQKIAGSYIDNYDWERYTYGILNNLENEIHGDL